MAQPDDTFNALSSLARANGHTLLDLSEDADRSNDAALLTLRECCDLVTHRDTFFSAWSSCYLRTLDEFIRRVPSGRTTATKLWKKLATPRSSQFLDTVVEAVWYLHLSDSGMFPDLEVPFMSTDPHAGDADLVVTRGGAKYWLDALSIKPTELEPRHPWGFAPSASSAAALLAKRARQKYDKKFRKHVRSGLLAGSHVGVLLCVLKSEPVLLPPLWFTPDLRVMPPADLFDERHESLALVTVHTLRADGADSILKPFVLLDWVRSEEHRLADA